MLLPVGGVLSHEFRNQREDGQCRQGQLLPFECDAWGNIDVVDRRFRRFELCRIGFGEGGKRRIGGIEGKRAGTMYGD